MITLICSILFKSYLCNFATMIRCLWLAWLRKGIKEVMQLHAIKTMNEFATSFHFPFHLRAYPPLEYDLFQSCTCCLYMSTKLDCSKKNHPKIQRNTANYTVVATIIWWKVVSSLFNWIMSWNSINTCKLQNLALHIIGSNEKRGKDHPF